MTPPPAPISIRSLHAAHHLFHIPKVITLPELGCLIKKITWAGGKEILFWSPPATTEPGVAGALDAEALPLLGAGVTPTSSALAG